jgi:hypothetical protein
MTCVEIDFQYGQMRASYPVARANQGRPIRVTSLVRQLSEERQAWKLGFKWLEWRTGYAVSHLRSMERGARQPTLAALIAWAEALGFELVLRRKEIE